MHEAGCTHAQAPQFGIFLLLFVLVVCGLDSFPTAGPFGGARSDGGDGRQLRTAGGLVAVQPLLRAEPLPIPLSSRPDRLQPLLRVAATLLTAVPDTSAAAIRGAARRWHEAVAFWGVQVVGWEVVAAYVVARSCPPLGVQLPSCCDRPVLPTTVASEVSALRRAAGLAVEGMGRFAPALSHPQVSRLLRQIGGFMKKLKSDKKPVLLAEVRRFWEACEAEGSVDAIRDGFAVVLGFCFGCRARELLGLNEEDLKPIALVDGRPALQVTFKRTKNRQSLFVTHQPFRVVCAHAMLLRAFTLFNDKYRFLPGAPVFRLVPGEPQPQSRGWLAAVLRRVASGATPHALRVGLATELWAAGASMDAIMTAGRWLSRAAALYVIGSLNEQVEATDRLADGSLVYTSAGLQRRLRSDAVLDDLPSSSVDEWSRVCLACEADGDVAVD